MSQAQTGGAALIVRDVQAFATSFPVAPGDGVVLGVCRAIKRDAVIAPTVPIRLPPARAVIPALDALEAG